MAIIDVDSILREQQQNDNLKRKKEYEEEQRIQKNTQKNLQLIREFPAAAIALNRKMEERNLLMGRGWFGYKTKPIRIWAFYSDEHLLRYTFAEEIEHSIEKEYGFDKDTTFIQSVFVYDDIFIDENAQCYVSVLFEDGKRKYKEAVLYGVSGEKIARILAIRKGDMESRIRNNLKYNTKFGEPVY